MGSLFRSEKMTLCQLFLQSEAAYTCVSELGELGLVQFRDLNPNVNAFQRKFVTEIRRCEEMERKLRFLEKEVKKDKIMITEISDDPQAPQPKEMVNLEAMFDKLDTEMKEVNTNEEALKKSFLELTELKLILKEATRFFIEAVQYETLTGGDEGDEGPLIQGEESGQRRERRLGFVAGVIHRERMPAFERMLWRCCHGNVYLKQAEIEQILEDPATGEEVRKSVFIIFFQGELLKTKVKKICEGFRASLYPCPESAAERREMVMGVMTRIEDLKIVINQTHDHRRRVLVAAAKKLNAWFIQVRKIKANYHVLNQFNIDVTQNCLIAEGWCAVDDLDKIQLALRRGTERSGSSVPSILNRMETKQAPPTYNRTNKFTSAFQALIDAYGVANYREVNPAPFAIISFPFLFSVMFGDWGHGIIMFLFALWMVVREKQLGATKGDNEIWNTFFGGRYIILLMGIFSIYAGLMYNDCFAKPVNIFGYSWIPVYDNQTIRNHTTLMMDPLDAYRGVPYWFGIDPMWQLASNKITFLNSFKMKLSVVLGISQMLFGLCLSFVNHVHFRNYVNIFCEFIPGVIFLMSLFGYLVALILYKWIHYSAKSKCAPMLLIQFINMFLQKYNGQCAVGPFYDGQQTVQTFLLVLALLCVPWMLFVKPLYLYCQSRRRPSRQYRGSGAVHLINEEEEEEEEALLPASVPEEPEEKFDFGDVFVHQAIHTIEFCLGCVSNTASYLRLWALSLAHAQLSEVLWEMVMRNAFGVNSWVGSIVMVVIFAAWAVLTVAILLLMEGLSAFLHTLRLHWVEFQNKFYMGTGYLFEPFSFQIILEEKGGSED